MGRPTTASLVESDSSYNPQMFTPLEPPSLPCSSRIWHLTSFRPFSATFNCLELTSDTSHLLLEAEKSTCLPSREVGLVNKFSDFGLNSTALTMLSCTQTLLLIIRNCLPLPFPHNAGLQFKLQHSEPISCGVHPRIKTRLRSCPHVLAQLMVSILEEASSHQKASAFVRTSDVRTQNLLAGACTVHQVLAKSP
ncbi:hypothetical protein N431DRAFT_55665 [Stipitochalara longipes BDJ]|nr:hypothetical protein N431DRAFT_55665 [Stipitochalara longipes BDJ]